MLRTFNILHIVPAIDSIKYQVPSTGDFKFRKNFDSPGRTGENEEEDKTKKKTSTAFKRETAV